MQPSVLHITAHLGQGIGKALVGAMVNQGRASSPIRHHVLCLGRPEKDDYVIQLRNAGITVDIKPEKTHLDSLISAADIIQFEWWHHPLLSELLATYEWKKGRYIFWCHISGMNFPCIPDMLPDMAHRFVLTSPISHQSPAIRKAVAKHGPMHCPMIPSVGNFFKSDKKSIGDGLFHIGYCGTLSYAKMHPAYLQTLAVGNKANYRYHFAGDLPSDHDIIAEAQALGIEPQTRFHGFVSPVEPFLACLDAFVYLLQPQHYGTTENALLEAMAAGVPVIALNQSVEKCIIDPGITGILLDRIEDLPLALEWIENNPEQALSIAKNAQRHISENYNAHNSRLKFENLYTELLNSNPQEFAPAIALGATPFEWFLAGQSEERRSEYLRMSQTQTLPACHWSIVELGHSKSSARQYHSFFRRDSLLAMIVDLLPKAAI